MEFGSYWPYPLVMTIVKAIDPSFGVKKGSDIIPIWNKIHSCKDIFPIKSFYCLREPMIVAALNAINIEMISSLIIYVWEFHETGLFFLTQWVLFQMEQNPFIEINPGYYSKLEDSPLMNIILKFYTRYQLKIFSRNQKRTVFKRFHRELIPGERMYGLMH